MAILRLVYLAAGSNDALHTQARYAMLSALAWGDGEQRIHLHTDAAERYRRLAETPAGQIAIEPVENIAPGKIFETKLSIIRDCAQRFSSDAILFCDADTFFVRTYDGLRKRMLDGKFFLHRPEYEVASHPTPQMRKFRRALRKAGFSGEGAMWNSGVVGLPPGHAHVLDNALKLFARVSPHSTKKYLAEQYSASLALSLAGSIAPAEDFVFHYWYQKAEYTAAIQERLERWERMPPAQVSLEMKTGRIILPAGAQKLHWWETLFAGAGLRQKPPDIRGLPK